MTLVVVALLVWLVACAMVVSLLRAASAGDRSAEPGYDDGRGRAVRAPAPRSGVAVLRPR